MKKQITWILSDVNSSSQFEGIIESLVSREVNLSFILINMEGSSIDRFIKGLGLQVLHLEVLRYVDYLQAIYQTIKYFKFQKTETVHCHLLKANLVGLLAAWLAKVPKRIYTRHHSTYHHLYSKRGVILDKWINRLSTDIVAISNITKDVLHAKEMVPLNKIHSVPHGFDFSKMEAQSLHKKKWTTLQRKPVIGVVSRFIEWKGIQFIIPAFYKLLEEYQEALLLLVGSAGPYRSEIVKKLNILPQQSYEIHEFENNVFPIYKEMDIFVHVPINGEIEAFGQIYIEALAMCVPSVFSLSGIANEFIKDRENALVVDYQNDEEIYQAIKILLKDNALAKKISKRGESDVSKLFKVKDQANQLIELYS
ncbi:MAG: glycosyltransferase family 4 protein [Bacteroidota bacterium]